MKTLTEAISDYRNAIIEHKVSLFREQLVLESVKTEMERKPLTDEEIEQLMKWPEKGTDLLDFARAIERAHGIGGEE